MCISTGRDRHQGQVQIKSVGGMRDTALATIRRGAPEDQTGRIIEQYRAGFWDISNSDWTLGWGLPEHRGGERVETRKSWDGLTGSGELELWRRNSQGGRLRWVGPSLPSTHPCSPLQHHARHLGSPASPTLLLIRRVPSHNPSILSSLSLSSHLLHSFLTATRSCGVILSFPPTSIRHPAEQ